MIKHKEVKHLSVGINRTPDQVYAYAGDPANLPAWAAGLASGISRAGEHWQVATPQGRLTLRFTEPNGYGVLDHTVVLSSGAEVHVPMRVLANGECSEVVITLYRQPEMDDAAYARDIGIVERDLATLKSLLER